MMFLSHNRVPAVTAKSLADDLAANGPSGLAPASIQPVDKGATRPIPVVRVEAGDDNGGKG